VCPFKRTSFLPTFEKLHAELLKAILYHSESHNVCTQNSATWMCNVVSTFFIDVLPGCCAVFMSSPLWVANTRLKLQGVRVSSRASHQLPTHSGIIGTSVSCWNLFIVSISCYY